MCSLSYDQTSSASAKDVVELRVKQIQLVSRFFNRRLRSDLRHKSMFRLVMLQFASGRPLIPISCMNYHRKDSACPLLLICAQQPLGALFPNLECLQLSDSTLLTCGGNCGILPQQHVLRAPSPLCVARSCFPSLGAQKISCYVFLCWFLVAAKLGASTQCAVTRMPKMLQSIKQTDQAG